MKRVRIRFLKTDSPFRRGEERDFPEKEAMKFVRHGVAELCVRETTQPGDEFARFEPDGSEEEDNVDE